MLDRILSALERTARFTPAPRRAVLIEHVDRVADAAGRGVAAPADLARLQNRCAKLRSAIRTSPT